MVPHSANISILFNRARYYSAEVKGAEPGPGEQHHLLLFLHGSTRAPTQTPQHQTLLPPGRRAAREAALQEPTLSSRARWRQAPPLLPPHHNTRHFPPVSFPLGEAHVSKARVQEARPEPPKYSSCLSWTRWRFRCGNSLSETCTFTYLYHFFSFWVTRTEI